MDRVRTFKEFYDHEATRLIDSIKQPIPEGTVLYFKDEGVEQGKVIGPIILQLTLDNAVDFGWNYMGVAKVIAKRLAVELRTS